MDGPGRLMGENSCCRRQAAEVGKPVWRSEAALTGCRRQPAWSGGGESTEMIGAASDPLACCQGWWCPGFRFGGATPRPARPGGRTASSRCRSERANPASRQTPPRCRDDARQAAGQAGQAVSVALAVSAQIR